MIQGRRVWAYACASIDSVRVERTAAQVETIEDFARRLGRRIDGVFIDPAPSEDKPLYERQAGRELCQVLRRGDSVIASRADRVGASVAALDRILQLWMNLGVTVHFCDLGGVSLDPVNPSCRAMVNLIHNFAERQRRMLSVRAHSALAMKKAAGQRYTRIAPYGFAWKRRGKKTIMVPAPREQRICAKAAEMSDLGYSIDQIRQYFAYQAKVRNRNGNEFGLREIRAMIVRAAQLRADEALAE
jgi:DNA invertase Pin-like site-specific DNA recombinase